MRALIFSGHRLDAPGRAKPRFPSSAETEARRLIREAAQAAAEASQTPLRAFAGAASGGDVLFHEVCDELGIPSEVHLAQPPAEYIESSVADAGPDWISRFAAITASRPVHILADPDGDPGLSVWARSNRAMLTAAAEHAGGDITLIALWNGESADGPGGTADMVQQVRETGGRAIILDAKTLLPG